MTGWGKVVYFLIYVTLNELGNYLDQDSKYYTCPCYCEISHEHVRNKSNDRCKKSFTMAMQDSCVVHVICNNEVCRMDSSCYSDSSTALSLIEISLTK